MRLFLITAGMIFITVFALSCARAPVSSPVPGAFTSNGERIYFTGTSNSGQPITYSGGVMMMSLACINCHGTDGHGGRVRMMMTTFDVPDITWPVLTKPTDDRPAYDEQGVKNAITRGLDASGGNLEAPMPVWQMSDSDLSDLIAFLKTLK